MQRDPLSYSGRKESKKCWEVQNEVTTILALKLRRISKCFLKQTTCSTLPQTTETTVAPRGFFLNTQRASNKHTPFNKTETEPPNASGAEERTQSAT